MSTNICLRNFKDAWMDFIRAHSIAVESRSKGALKRVADWFIIQEKYDAELLDLVSRNISQLHDDWIFLDNFAVYMFWEISSSRIIEEVCSLGLEIQSVISSGEKYLKRPLELLSILLECRRKTDEVLIPEIGEAVEYLVELNHELSMNLIMKNVRRNVVLIKSADVIVEGYDVLINELLRIQTYIQQLRFETGLFKSIGHPLTTYLASVVGKIASKSFNVWINRHDTEIAKARATELVEIRHQFAFANPEFMKLLLNFQVAINVYHQYESYAFCDYILTASLNDPYRYQDLREELRSLVNIYVLNTLQDHSSREDLSSLFLEIEAVLREISILHCAIPQGNEDKYTLSRLLLKVRILKMELFIKKQLIISRHSSMVFIDGDLLMNNLKGLVKGLLHQIDPECDGKQYLTLASEMNDIVESLPWSRLQSEEHKNFLVNCSLRKLLYKIVFFKAENVLLDLPKKCTTTQSDDESLIACASEDQIPFLEEELKHFKQLVASQLMWTSPEEEIIFIQIEELARRITLLGYSTLPDNDKDIFLSLPQLSDKVKFIKAEVREISPPVALSDFPKIFKLSFIHFLGRNIKELLKCDPVLIYPLRDQLKQVDQQLASLGSLLMKASFSPVEVENGCLKDIGDRIRDTTHKMEYTVESVELDSQSKYSFWLYNLLEDIVAINQQVSKVVDKCHADSLGNPPWVSREILSKDYRSSINEITVALAAEEEAIINQLIRGSSQRDIVSIVGMAGIGKSTLARKVYSSQHVFYHFPRCAWCAVSQVYSKRELLLDILSDIHGITNEIQQMNEEDLRSKLRRCLLGNRYLIILDDLWDITVWNYLEMSFPNDRNGSRILITSRLQNLHSRIQPGSNPHLMRLFSDEESWMLLEKKIFEEGVSCPKELLLLGRQIAHHCQGLPLAILAISGLLRKTEKTRDWWEEISKSLCTQVINDPENKCKEILELSYRHLPDDLKACFLHLSVFLADKDIPMTKLIQLWIAEGFVQETVSKSLEEVALDYAMELINRSLVIISRKRSNGRVKACRLHDLLRDLCQSKAKDENFLNLVSRFDEPFSAYPDSEYDMEFYNQDLLHPVTFESYRLSIYLTRNHFIDSKPSGPITRSLIFFASADKEPKCPYGISFICKNFRLLRVLDLECINMGFSFPDEFGLMVHLRYLGVSGYLRSIPSSIANLWKLQFFVVKGFRGTIILPYSIWSMGNLRHLHVNEHVSFDLEGDDELSGSLDNLVSLSTPLLSLGGDTTNLLRRLPNLLKMRCIFLEPRNSSKSSSQFPMLGFLTRMEFLKIIYIGTAFNAGEFHLPLSLKKLTLSGFPLSWNHMSKIGGLPNLRVFKLLSPAFEGTKWEMEEDEFKQLELLKLENLNIAEWAASYDHLPHLKRLVLRNCNDLEEVPQDFADISTLEKIEVQWFHAS